MPVNQLTNRVRSFIANADVYHPALSVDELLRLLPLKQITKLGSNENALGSNPDVIKAITEVLPQLHRYSDSSSTPIRLALAHYYHIPKEYIIMGNGSADVLATIAHTFIEPGDEVISAAYSFCLFKILTQLMGGHYKTVPLHGWFTDVERLVEVVTPKTKIIYLAAPNNPTGVWITHAEVEYLLQHVPENVLCIIDEAYIEYNTRKDKPNSIALIQQYPHFCITRTFSKAFGLAGLRIGYGITHPDLVKIFDRIRLSFNLNSIGTAAAIASLTNPHFLQRSIELNTQERARIANALDEWGVNYIPTETNFFTIDIESPARIIYQALLERGLITRTIENYQMPNFLGVTIGQPHENDLFLSEFKTIYIDRKKG